jgi:hypothetical protein
MKVQKMENRKMMLERQFERDLAAKEEAGEEMRRRMG